MERGRHKCEKPPKASWKLAYKPKNQGAWASLTLQPKMKRY
jgi:hypothetical protein